VTTVLEVRTIRGIEATVDTAAAERHHSVHAESLSKDDEAQHRTRPMGDYAIVSDISVIGCVGTLIVATRGNRGAGEVLLTVQGSREAFLAWSDDPLPKGTKVLVVEVRGARAVVVEPWKDLL
jgi:hypothetical protein